MRGPRHRDTSYPTRTRRPARKPKHAAPWTEHRIASDYAARWTH